MGAMGSSSHIFDIAKASARELMSVGINWNFAPVLDVLKDSPEPVVTVRSFGNSPEFVARMGTAYLEGLRAGGVASCAKHFPGISITSPDGGKPSEDGRQTSQSDEIDPFRRAVRNVGLDSVMLSHTAFASSKDVVRETLRRSLNFHGIVVADCSAYAVPDSSTVGRTSVVAVENGCDIFVVSDLQAARSSGIETVYRAVKDGELRRDDLNNSCKRIGIMKRHYLRWEVALNPRGQNELSFLIQQHQSLTKRAYERSVTMIRSHKPTLSAFAGLQESDILLLLTPIVRPVHPPDGEPIDPFEVLGRALASRHSRVRHVPYSAENGVTSTHAAFINRAAAVVLVTCNAVRPTQNPQIRHAKTMRAICKGKPLIAVAVCDPCDLLDDKHCGLTLVLKLLV
jgi:beta-N-acetylhexosaminidase